MKMKIVNKRKKVKEDENLAPSLKTLVRRIRRWKPDREPRLLGLMVGVAAGFYPLPHSCQTRAIISAKCIAFKHKFA